MLTSLISAAFNAIAGLIGSLITRWLGKREDMAEGVRAQAATETAAAEKVETAIAQAEATAPRTDKAIEDRFNAGSV